MPLLGEVFKEQVRKLDGKISERVSNRYCSFSEIACLIVRTSFLIFDVFVFFSSSWGRSIVDFFLQTVIESIEDNQTFLIAFYLLSCHKIFLFHFHSYFVQISVQYVIKSMEHLKKSARVSKLHQLFSHSASWARWFQWWVFLDFYVILYRLHSLHIDITLFSYQMVL